MEPGPGHRRPRFGGDVIVVVAVEEHPNAEPRKPQPGNENYVVIDHGDHTFGRYYHLDQNGAEVVMGETVAAGQLIGRSGNSGATFGPHLHFDVTGGCFEWGCQTVRFRFSGVEDDPLVEGETYGGTTRGHSAACSSHVIVLPTALWRVSGAGFSVVSATARCR